MNPQEHNMAVLGQIVKHIPKKLIEKLKNRYKIQTRSFSATSHVVAMLYAQLSHALSLNDICDCLRFHSGYLSQIRDCVPPSRNGLAHANSTRDSAMADDNGRKRIFFPEMPDEHLKINEPLATGIARAYRWQELLDKGEYDSPEALAEALGVHTSYVRRFLRLALLAPPIVDAIFAGKAPWTLSLTKLDTTLPYSWKEQMELFGMV